MMLVFYADFCDFSAVERGRIIGSPFVDFNIYSQGIVLAPELENFISDIVGCPFTLGYQFFVLCSITEFFYGRTRIL